jgi:DNA-binding protein HU-beta
MVFPAVRDSSDGPAGLSQGAGQFQKVQKPLQYQRKILAKSLFLRYKLPRISKSRRWRVTKSELLGNLAAETGLKKKEVDNVLQALRSIIYKTLKKDYKIKLDGLGVFQLKDRKARMARNPRTGEMVSVPAKKVVKFRVLKDLKEAVLS